MAESGANKMEMVNEQAVAGKWNYMRSELNQLYNKINELEQELNEHQLVISAIQPLDPGRKCFRMIGGVLVERTVGGGVACCETKQERSAGSDQSACESVGEKNKGVRWVRD